MPNPEQETRVNQLLSSVINDAENAAAAARARNRRGYLVSNLISVPRVDLTPEIENKVVHDFCFHLHHYTSRFIRELLPSVYGKIK